MELKKITIEINRKISEQKYHSILSEIHNIMESNGLIARGFLNEYVMTVEVIRKR